MTSQHGRIFWLGLLILVATSALFYLVIPYLGIDHRAMSFKQFIYHSLWRILTTGTLLFLLLRYFDKRFELKRKSLDETFQRYEAINRATNDAIWDYDLVNGEVYYNERIHEIFGYTKNELSDNHGWWESHIHLDDRERVVQKMNLCLSGQADNWEDEYRFATSAGQWKIVYDRSFIMRDQTGKPVRMIGAMKDVTELRRMEKELHEQQLQEKNRKGQGIIRSYEMDRKKVRDALHEDVNQVLAAVKIHMADTKTSQGGDPVTANMGHLDSVIQKIRKISNTLSSFTFDFMGLCVAIEEQISIIQMGSPIVIKFQHDGFDEERVRKEAGLILYQLTEYILSQAGGAGGRIALEIRLKHEGGRSLLTISYRDPNQPATTPMADPVIQELRAKLEMYEGNLAIKQEPGSDWIIVAMV